MKKILLLAFFTGTTFLIGTAPVSAQDGPVVIPVEMFTCTFNDGKDADDLDDVVDKWNAWADEQGVDDYAAWTLTPYYYGPGANAGFDVIWMGAAKNGVALGTRQDQFMAEDAGLNEDFNEVISCGSHVNYASINHKAPPQGATPANSIITFSDCSFKEGATGAAVDAATAEWSQYMTDQGSSTGIFHWYPAYGGGGGDFDFKWLEAHESLAALGADFDNYGNGGGYVKDGQLFDHLLDCDP
ncbi:MAG: hypothetical protein ACI88G_001880, partial [Woeseiaceae bacterium]